MKKNYRRLSLKHHPDRKTGDAECFRMLNRAKIVLSSPKLRREYDLVGLDLEDDAEDHDHEDDHNTNDATNNGAATASATENGEGGGEAHHEDSAKDGNQNKTETVMGHLASATLAAVLQVVVRTALMCLVSVLISRYTILVRYYWELFIVQCNRVWVGSGQHKQTGILSILCFVYSLSTNTPFWHIPPMY